MKLVVFLLSIIFTIPIAQAKDWITGGVYSVPYESGQYVIIKVIKTDSIGVHLKLYANKFDKKPNAIKDCELKGLEVETEHVAIAHSSFNNWSAEFICKSIVNEKELEAFHVWHKNNGGFF